MGYLTANDRPGVHPASWYAETAGPLPEYPALQCDTRADVCVIGGGYTGLSAALHLAQAGVDVVLVEANRVAWGASGRNGGQLGIGPRAEMADYEAAVGLDDARKVWEIAVAANALVRKLISDHAIDCDLRDGYVEAAAKPRHAGPIQAVPDHLARVYGHGTCRALDRDEVAAMLGTSAYHGGYLDTMGAHLHPLRLGLGYARAAAAAGARLHERTRVTALAKGRATTTTGTIHAEHILLACNGYLDGLEPEMASRILPINNFIAATEPLGERMPMRSNVCVADSFFVLNYFRQSPDGRLLWGGGESYGKRFPRDIGAVVRRRLTMIYPELQDVNFTHAWGGTLAITGTRFPVFLRKPWGLALGGWSGSGIHMGTMGGKLAANAIRGDSAAFDLLARMPNPTFPGGAWFRAPLMAAAMTWYALRDRFF